MSNAIAVHKSNEGRYFISWSGGRPLAVAATRDEAAASLRDASDFPESEIQRLLNNPNATSSVFLANALVGLTAEFNSNDAELADRPTNDAIDSLSSRLADVVSVVAGMSSTVVKQQQQIQLTELEKVAALTITRTVMALEAERIPSDEAKAIAIRNFNNSGDGRRLAVLRTELANG